MGAGSQPSDEEEASLEPLGDRAQQFVPDTHMLRVASPGFKGGLVGEVVANCQVHVPGSSSDVAADDNILAPREG